LEDKKVTIPVLTGPTGSGKTSVGIRLMDQFPGVSLISADSRQIYKHVSIGTDKPSKLAIKKYKFKLVDFVEPGDRYTAFNFAEDSLELINNSLKSKKLPPLVCGGTGLYLRALTDGLIELPDDDLKYRTELEETAITKGPQYLFEKLEKIDPLEASKIHPHNIKKLIRALEIYRITGKPKSKLIADQRKSAGRYNYDIICLMPSREKLYKKINERVDNMIQIGLLDEVDSLISSGLQEAIRKVNIIGYNELFDYRNGKLTFNEAVNLIKQNSRRYAKRQITWFRGLENKNFIPTADETFNYISALYERI